MRKAFFAVTALVLAPTAAMASSTTGDLVGDTGFGAAAALAIHNQTDPSGAENGRAGVLRGNLILAKGDKSGSGPGHGGHKGQKKGGNHGKQKKDKS